MRVGIVLSGLAPGAVDSRLLEAALAISERHAVHVWAPPGAMSLLRRRLPSAIKVEHADAVEQRAASRRLRPRRPRVLRKEGISDARLDTVLSRLKADIVILPASADAQRARRVLDDSTALLEWSPALLEAASADSKKEPSPSRNVLAMGDLVGSSRFGDAIRAFDDASVSGDGWHMEVCGSGSHESGLRDLIAWRGLEARVDVAPPRGLHEDLSRASILVATARHAVPSFQALEAAAAGVPVVGFDDDPVATLVAAAGAGHVVPAGSTAALGAVLRRLIDDNAAREDCATNGRQLSRGLADVSEPHRWLLLVDAVANNIETARARVLPAGDVVGDQARAHTRTVAEAIRGISVAVEQSLTEAGVLHAFVEAKDGRAAIVVAVEDRDAVARALFAGSGAAIGGATACVGSVIAHGQLITAPDALPAFYDVVDRLRVFDETLSAEVYVDVEFWLADADGIRHAPRRNRETIAVGASAWAAWTSARSRTVTEKPLWDDVTFPIDAVFTWVDGADPTWLASRSRFVAGDDIVTGARPERFLNRDEIYYAVAAAHQNLPWLRRIIVVTDGQRHDRIGNDFPEVEFIDHRAIFPDPRVLPVFNSHAIEATLHRVPDLAEHFLYINDDVFVTQPMNPSDFFDANGVARFFPSGLQADFADHGAIESHLLAAANNRHLILRDFGLEITNSMLHTPHPHVRSVLEDLEERYSAEFEVTQRSRFRSGEDLSVLSSLAQYYGWATQRYRPGRIRYEFLRLHGRVLEERMRKIVTDTTIEVVCMGEPLPHQSRHPEEKRLVQEFLDQIVR